MYADGEMTTKDLLRSTNSDEEVICLPLLSKAFPTSCRNLAQLKSVAVRG